MRFEVFDALEQKALPLPGILPKSGDELVLNYLYDRSLIVAPNKEIYSPTAFVNGRSSVIIREIVEHCGYNRTPGCALVDGRLQVRCLFNDSLLTSLRGAVWNFPAFRKGRFTVSLRFNDLATKGHLLLNDRWFNPTDSVARYYAPF